MALIRGGSISVEGAREATIIFDGERKVGDGKAAFIKPKSGRAVVRFGEWVVKNDRVRKLVSSNRYAI